MALMRCPVGAVLQTLHGHRYGDDDCDGLVEIGENHIPDAVKAGWVTTAPAPMDAALDHLDAGVAAQADRVEELREEALAQLPEEHAMVARAEMETAIEGSDKAAPAQQTTQAVTPEPTEEATSRGRGRR